MNETAPAKATSAGQIFVSTGANAIAARKVAADFIATQETSTSTSYVDLATAGPAVTATTSASAIVATYCNMFNTTNPVWMSYAISGATTDTANDNRGIQVQPRAGSDSAAMFFHSAILTSGTNTFTAKYRVSTSGTGTWSDRRLMVIPM